MGWFSAAEIVAPTASSENSGVTTQTVAICVLAGVAVSYLFGKAIAKLHRQHTEKIAETTARRMAAQV